MIRSVSMAEAPVAVRAACAARDRDTGACADMVSFTGMVPAVAWKLQRRPVVIFFVEKVLLHVLTHASV